MKKKYVEPVSLLPGEMYEVESRKKIPNIIMYDFDGKFISFSDLRNPKNTNCTYPMMYLGIEKKRSDWMLRSPNRPRPVRRISPYRSSLKYKTAKHEQEVELVEYLSFLFKGRVLFTHKRFIKMFIRSF